MQIARDMVPAFTDWDNVVNGWIFVRELAIFAGGLDATYLAGVIVARKYLGDVHALPDWDGVGNCLPLDIIFYPPNTLGE